MSVVSFIRFVEGPFGDRSGDNRDCRMNKNFGTMERSTAIVKGTKGEFGRGFFMLMAK